MVTRSIVPPLIVYTVFMDYASLEFAALYYSSKKAAHQPRHTNGHNGKAVYLGVKEKHKGDSAYNYFSHALTSLNAFRANSAVAFSHLFCRASHSGVPRVSGSCMRTIWPPFVMIVVVFMFFSPLPPFGDW